MAKKIETVSLSNSFAKGLSFNIDPEETFEFEGQQVGLIHSVTYNPFGTEEFFKGTFDKTFRTAFVNAIAAHVFNSVEMDDRNVWAYAETNPLRHGGFIGWINENNLPIRFVEGSQNVRGLVNWGDKRENGIRNRVELRAPIKLIGKQSYVHFDGVWLRIYEQADGQFTLKNDTDKRAGTKLYSALSTIVSKRLRVTVATNVDMIYQNQKPILRPDGSNLKYTNVQENAQRLLRFVTAGEIEGTKMYYEWVKSRSEFMKSNEEGKEVAAEDAATENTTGNAVVRVVYVAENGKINPVKIDDISDTKLVSVFLVDASGKVTDKKHPAHFQVKKATRNILLSISALEKKVAITLK